MAQSLKAFARLAMDLGSISALIWRLIIVCNSNFKGVTTPSSDLCGHKACIRYTFIYLSKPLTTYKIKTTTLFLS